MGRAVVCVLLLLGALAACEDDEIPTQLVVRVNSDFKPVTELAEVQVAVTAGGHTVEQRWTVVRRDPDKDKAMLPFSFGIVPPGGDIAARVDITVAGLDPAKDTLVRRRVRVGFVEHQMKLLAIDLTHDCAERFESCEAEGTESARSTCVDGECTSIDVDVNDLPSIRPGEEVDGVTLLPWHCTRNCEDGGPDANMSMDGGHDAGKPDGSAHDSGPESGAGTNGGGGSGGMDGSAGSSAGSGGGGTGGQAGTDDVDGDVVPPPGACGNNNQGFFADVEYRLTRTEDRTPCPTIAQNCLDDIPADAGVGESTTKLKGLIDRAVAADLDIIELWVSQSGPTLYATGSVDPMAPLPELAAILDYETLRDTTRPLKLYITDAVPEPEHSEDFARPLLAMLLARQASDAGGYATECRPIYVDAGDYRGLFNLSKVQELLANDTAYASLRGHLHFGVRVPDYEGAEDAREWIDWANGFEYADIGLERPSAFPLVRYAQSKGLHVFARDANDTGFAPMCGMIDALGTPRHSYVEGTDFRDSIASSRMLIDLDIASVASDATKISFAVAPSHMTEKRSLGSSTPSLGSGELTQALPGTYFSFDASAKQSLTLNNPALPEGTNKLSMLVVLRLDPDTLPNGGRAVIASKRQGSSGWALELVDNSGTRVVQFESFLRNPSNGDVLQVQAAISADDFVAGTSHHVFAAIDRGSYLRLHEPPEWNRIEPYEYSIIDSDAPVTLGSDPGATSGYFNGELQLFKLVSYNHR